MIKFYTLHYNNYYNRILKKLTDVDDYLDATYYTDGHLVSNVSFNPGDGLKTIQVVNYSADEDDYAIVVKEIKDAQDNVTKEVISRWFILKSDRTKTGQYILTLKRDVLADKFDTLLTSPMFVHKGILSQDDSMICNPEGMMVNEIKVGEDLLKSKFNCPWIVGYVAKDNLGKSKVDVTGEVAPAGAIALSAIETDIGRTLDVEGTDTINILADSLCYTFNIAQAHGITITGHKYEFWRDKYFNESVLTFIGFNLSTGEWAVSYNTSVSSYPPVENAIFDNAIVNAMNSIDNNTLEALKQSFALDNLENATILSKLNSYVGKYILSNGRYYKMNLSIGSVKNKAEATYSNNATATGAIDALSQVRDALNNQLSSINIPNYSLYSNSYFITIKNICIDSLSISFQDVTEDATAVYSVPLADEAHRRHASGAVYDIFAIPFGEVYLGQSSPIISSITNVTMNNTDMLLKLASSLAEQLDAKCYDVQLLPYMPALESIWFKTMQLRPLPQRPISYDGIDITTIAEGYDFDYITRQESGSSTKTNVGVIFWLKSANEQLVINKSYNYINSANRKIESNTTKFRLCSPNYNGLFDMNLAKNKGIDYFNVSISFKPYQPYIHVQPNFKELYSNTDYKDYRGLICGGDFSLSRVKDAWINYQLQNVNYQKIFDREIQNLDFTQSQEYKLSIVQAVTSGITGGVAGGVVGGVVGAAAGPYGALAGAAIGGVVSGGANIAGAAADISMLKDRQAENRDYAKDRFNYQLGNIRALPDSLTKVDLFNPDSRLFPFVEMYSCSQEETEALERKIQFNGMTVERIDYMPNFTSEDNSNWFSATLIKNTNLNAEAEMFYVINDELIKGVYI